MTPIHALVFVKDRAMQLDACLRSLARHMPCETMTVLADRPDPSYDLCAAENPGPNWVYDTDSTFEEEVRVWLAEHERVLFVTDDEIFFADPPRELLELDNSETVLTLRQGRNTVWCHPLACPQPVPETFPWLWRDARLDFAYPLSLNGTLYNTKDLLPLLDFRFGDPTQLEAQLAANAARFAPAWMTAPERSCVVNLPLNLTSVSSGNPHGHWPDYQPAALDKFYRAGWRIDLDQMDFSGVNAAHVELPLAFTRIL